MNCQASDEDMLMTKPSRIIKPSRPSIEAPSPIGGSAGPGWGPQDRILIRASRAFAGPGQYPPTQFAAYGIVAFQSLPFDIDETNRYLNICRGYLAAIPRAKNLLDQGIPLSKQMVTVWPLDNARYAGELNISNQDLSVICRKAVSTIDISTSRNAILNARLTKPGRSFDGRGP